MTKTSGKKLNLLKSLEILQSNPFISFYHFNNLSKKEWDEIKLELKELLRTKRVALNLKGLFNKTCQADKAAKGFFAGKREPFEVKVLVLKSKAVVKLLGPLLLAANNQKKVEETPNFVQSVACEAKHTYYPKRCKAHLSSAATVRSKAKGGKGLQDVPRKPNNLACFAGAKQACGTQETAFKDRVSSLTRALSLIEGPTLLVGAFTVEGFRESAKRLEKEKGLVFVGGVLENQFINHLDLKDCLKRDLLSPAHLVQTLRLSLTIPPLAYYSNKLLFLLQKRQESLRDC